MLRYFVIQLFIKLTISLHCGVVMNTDAYNISVHRFSSMGLLVIVLIKFIYCEDVSKTNQGDLTSKKKKQ